MRPTLPSPRRPDERAGTNPGIRVTNLGTPVRRSGMLGAMERRLSSREVVAIVAIFLGGMLVDVAERLLSPDFADQRPTWHFFAKRGVVAVGWMVLASGVLARYKRRPADFEGRAATLATLATALGLATGCAIVLGLALAGMFPLLGVTSFARALRLIWPGSFVYDFLTAVQVVVAANGYLYYRRMNHQRKEAAALALALREAELALLRAQLEPHFLFNTLNTIASLVRLDRRPAAIDALALLAGLLRGVVEAGDGQLVSWRWEREFSQTYLALQQLRFDDRLAIELTADGVPPDAQLPLLLLQPLLENAITHGPLDDGERCVIALRVHTDGARLVVRVDNACARTARKGAGVALANLGARLRALYGGDATLAHGRDADRYAVRIELPLRLPPRTP